MRLQLATSRANSRYYLTVFLIYISIFVNSIVFFTEPFEFYIGYLIFIVLLPPFVSRYGFDRDLALIFSVLLFVGVIYVSLGYNTAQQFFKIYIGLLLSYFFYYYVILEFNFDVERLFKWYLKGCYVAALIGIVQFVSFKVNFRPGYDFTWFLNKWGIAPGGNFGIRVNSIFGEPTYLGAVLSAAFFVAVYNLLRRQSYGLTTWQSTAIVLVYFLSFSGLGQVGIFLTLIFLAVNFGFMRYFFLAIPAFIFLFNVMYRNVQDFRDRYDGLVQLFVHEEFQLGKTHGSSYILYNNYKVAIENFKGNFAFGTGLGSHATAFAKFSRARDIKVYGFNLNSADANSMLLRLISETGLFGVLLFTLLIFRCYVRRNKEDETFHWMVSNSILIMILLNLFRQGHYFLNGFPFFVLLYYFNWRSYNKYRLTGRTLYEETVAEIESKPPPPPQFIR